MSKKLRKITRRERVALTKQWPSLFPVVLLMFGPPPNRDIFDEKERHWTEYEDAKGKYYGSIARWYHDNYLHMYEKPKTIVRGLSDGFRWEFKKWWEKQVKRLSQ